MRGFGQIRDLCEIARPTLGAITAVGPVHLEFVGDVAGVARAKAELIEALPPGATAVVPAGVRELEPYLRDDLKTIRVGEDARLRSWTDGHLEAEVLGEPVSVKLPFRERHQAENALVALAVYAALGLPLAKVHEGASRIELSGLRGEEIALANGGVLINDCWNANPASMRAALDRAREAKRRQTDRRRRRHGRARPRGIALPPRDRRAPRPPRPRDRRRRARARATARANGFADADEAARASSRSCSSRATSCSSRARAR